MEIDFGWVVGWWCAKIVFGVWCFRPLGPLFLVEFPEGWGGGWWWCEQQ